jgi:hypothetical protein
MFGVNQGNTFNPYISDIRHKCRACESYPGEHEVCAKTLRETYASHASCEFGRAVSESRAACLRPEARMRRRESAA